jgi:hypothetical protein
MYGVPALAGKVLPFAGRSKHSEIHGETASDRLKPGLHTLSSSFACEICGLTPIPNEKWWSTPHPIPLPIGWGENSPNAGTCALNPGTEGEEHPAANSHHRTSNACQSRDQWMLGVGCWMLAVGCWRSIPAQSHPSSLSDLDLRFCVTNSAAAT